ncbi:MAG: hypothetical protein II649_02160 [Kiritimatiellae bacterium]|nr:hypothetical protein [Kiritimatiellia bacterium]
MRRLDVAFRLVVGNARRLRPRRRDCGIATTLEGGEVPEYGATSFLGREMSCTVGSDVVRIEALPLVAWLKAVADGSTVSAVSVTQPSDYATATLETWLGDASNAGAVMAFCWADEYAADASFAPLTVDGATRAFLYVAQDAGTEDSVAVTVVGANGLADESGFTADALTHAGSSGGVATYVSADTSATECFARLKFAKNW